MSDEKKRVVIHRDGSVTEQEGNDLPVVAIKENRPTKRALDECPRGGSHIWLHNVKMGWKICDKCGTRN